MAQLIACVGLFILGLANLLLPPDQLIQQDKLKNGETMEDATKKRRKIGIFAIIIAVVFFFLG